MTQGNARRSRGFRIRSGERVTKPPGAVEEPHPEEEVRHFNASNMPKTRPNTMNEHGVLMRELGLYEGTLDPLLQEYILPVVRLSL